MKRWIFILLLLASCAKDRDDTVEGPWDLLQAGPPPSQSEGTFGISARGGTGSKSTGGAGSTVRLSGATAQLTREGSVDTKFAAPSDPEDLGPNPRIVRESVTLEDERFTCPPTIPGGSSPDEAATGLKILSGVTLTFERFLPIEGCENNLVFFAKDIVVEGTVTTTVTGTGSLDQNELSLKAHRNLIIRSGGRVTTKGGSNTAGTGGKGGDITLTADGKVVILGSLDASGGDGTNAGGVGGAIVISAGAVLFNSGAIAANGGVASSGIGGLAGKVDFSSVKGTSCLFEAMFNSDRLSAVGGNGAVGGGNGGAISLKTTTCRGDLIEAGTLSVDGGKATGIAGNGGKGGSLALEVDGNIRQTGPLSANGGDSAGSKCLDQEAVDIPCLGGDAGTILITLSDPSTGKSIQIAADFSAHGGNGEGGGDGSASVIVDAKGGDLRLFNFKSFDLGGGGGKTDAGEGGRLILSSGGTLFNEIEVSIRGGVGSAPSGNGGPGGSADLSASDFLINYGKIAGDGGDGDNRGGAGGTMTLVSAAGTQPTGKLLNAGGLSANGGAASDLTKGVGGFGGEILLKGGRSVANRGALATNGGDAKKSGGGGGNVAIRAVSQTVNAGDLSSRGGKADVEIANSNGGSGGVIVLETQAQATANSASSISVEKGAGSAGSTATGGRIFIDGVDVTPSDGTLP